MPQKNDGRPHKKKKVTQQTLKRRRMIALIIIILFFVIIISAIVSSCSKKIGNSDDDSKPVQTNVITTAPDQNQITQTTTVQTGTIMEGVSSSSSAVTTSEPEGEKVQSIELTFYTCELEIGETTMPYVTMLPDTADLSEKWESSDESIATVDDMGNITAVSPGVCYITVSSVNNPEVYAQVKVGVKDENGIVPLSNSSGLTSAPQMNNKETTVTTVSANEPVYIQGILIANKSYALPEDYNPGLDSDTEAAFNELSAAAAEDGLDIWLASGFRSFDDQERIYNNYVNSYGQQSADTFSARPGHSEHQTGLAIDVNSIDDSFAGTPEAIWLEEHAHEYGFIIRYPKGKEGITGYKYEPWHIRYLGVEKAAEVYKSGLTLEEFLGIDSVYNE